MMHLGQSLDPEGLRSIATALGTSGAKLSTFYLGTCCGMEKNEIFSSLHSTHVVAQVSGIVQNLIGEEEEGQGPEIAQVVVADMLHTMMSTTITDFKVG